MSRHRTAAALAALSALTVLTASLSTPLSAQERYKISSSTLGRPRLGVMLHKEADPSSDKYGAKVDQVVPDSPADKAGLKDGDIITKFNTTSLGGLKADDSDESGPAEKLIELARKLEPGDTVLIEYRRGSDARKATLIAEDLPMFGGRGFHMEMPGMPGGPDMDFPRMMLHGGPGEGGMSFFMNDRLDGLDLVDINPDLGEYFGTKEGVLVVQTPTDSTNPLKAGDVILKIDGREPKSVSQAERILRSYDGGETAKLEVMRKQHRTTLTWTVPESKDREWHFRTPSPERVKIERT